MNWDAMMHDKKINLPGEKKEEEPELSPEDEALMNQALEAAILRKKMEMDRGRPHHSN